REVGNGCFGGAGGDEAGAGRKKGEQGFLKETKDLFGEVEAGKHSRHEGDDGIDEPLAELGQMLHQGLTSGLGGRFHSFLMSSLISSTERWSWRMNLPRVWASPGSFSGPMKIRARTRTIKSSPVPSPNIESFR